MLQLDAILPAGWRLSPTLLPALVAFATAPPASLRQWIAVQHLAAPEAVDPAQQKSMRRRKAIQLFALFAIIFSAEYFLIAEADQKLLSCIITVATGVLFQVSLMGFFSDFSGAVKWAAYRAPSGMTLWRFAPGTLSHVRMLGVVLLSGAINMQSFIEPHFFATFAITTALVHRFLTAGHHKTLSIRGIMFVLIGWIATSFLLSGLLVVLIVRLQQGEEAPVSPSPEELEPLSPRATGLTQFIASVLFTAGPGVLIAACYRFDYHHHQTTTQLALPTVELAERRQCPSRRRACEQSCATSTPLAPGVIIPTHAPRGFARPLYWTALLSWLAVQLATMAAFALLPIPKDLLEEHSVMDLAALAVAVPVQVVAVVLVACVTGRAREMWTYKEKWTVLPKVAEEGAIKLVSEELEAAPAYEVDFKEDVAVPAFPVDIKA
ncbi:hypothetical protein RQP46_009279 [Phenoliferia psychrophenolica]